MQKKTKLKLKLKKNQTKNEQTNKQLHLYFHPIFNERLLNVIIFKVVARCSTTPGVFSFTNLDRFIFKSINCVQILIFKSLIVQDSRNGIYFPIASSRAFPTSRKSTEVFFRALPEKSAKLLLFIFEFHVHVLLCVFAKTNTFFLYISGVYIFYLVEMAMVLVQRVSNI